MYGILAVNTQEAIMDIATQNFTRQVKLMVQWLRLCTPNAVGPGLIPRQGTKSQMLQVRVHREQLKIPEATMKIEDPKCHNQDLAQSNK